MIEVFWAFPISVTTTAGGPSWYILLCVWRGGVCAVMGCGSGDSAENTCWGTAVAAGIPEKTWEKEQPCANPEPMFSSPLFATR